MMKIVNLITSNQGKSFSGKGGHYYSMCKISNELNKSCDVKVFSIGSGESQVLNNYKKNLNISHIYSNNLKDLFFLNNKILNDAISESEIIHCYDTESLIYGIRFSRIFKKPLIFTKCGGKNPSGFFPFVQNIILFSEENKNYFLHQKKFSNSNISVIPNRVNYIKPDPERIKSLHNKINYQNEIIILCIARFGYVYKQAHEQTINLANYLRSKNIKCKAVLIGYPEDLNVVNSIKESCSENDSVITEKYFCNNANELIQIADIVVGQGRSIMEAAYFRKVLCIPHQSDELPILVNHSNFKIFIDHNMTSRGYKKKNNINDCIINAIEDSSYNEFSKNLFIENFDINRINKKYINIYNSVKYKFNFKEFIDLNLLKLNKSLKYINLKS